MRRWAALALLLGATVATLATIAVVVFQLADDGGALVAEAGRPSAGRPSAAEEYDGDEDDDKDLAFKGVGRAKGWSSGSALHASLE